MSLGCPPLLPARTNRATAPASCHEIRAGFRRWVTAARGHCARPCSPLTAMCACLQVLSAGLAKALSVGSLASPTTTTRAHSCQPHPPVCCCRRPASRYVLQTPSPSPRAGLTVLHVTAIKIDPYMNVDAGTMAPTEYVVPPQPPRSELSRPTGTEKSLCSMTAEKSISTLETTSGISTSH